MAPCRRRHAWAVAVLCACAVSAQGLQAHNDVRHTGNLQGQISEGTHGEARVELVQGNKRVQLPLSPLRDTDGHTVQGYDLVPGAVSISPDQQWVYVDAKVCRGVTAGWLFHRAGAMSFKPATPVRFDEAAWRYYCHIRSWSNKKIASINDGPRLIDFVSWSADSKRLTFRLRPVAHFTQQQGWGPTLWYHTRAGQFGGVTKPQR